MTNLAAQSEAWPQARPDLSQPPVSRPLVPGCLARARDSASLGFDSSVAVAVAALVRESRSPVSLARSSRSRNTAAAASRGRASLPVSCCHSAGLNLQEY